MCCIFIQACKARICEPMAVTHTSLMSSLQLFFSRVNLELFQDIVAHTELVLLSGTNVTT